MGGFIMKKFLRKLKCTSFIIAAVMVLGLAFSPALFQDKKVNAAEYPGTTIVPTPAATRLVITIYLGDVDENKVVNSLDLAKYKQYLLGEIKSLPEAGDVNQDGEMNSIDYALIKAYLLGLVKDLGTKTIWGPPVPTPYVPTPTPIQTPKPTIKIMPLGDSITDGITVPGAYRTRLWKNITSNGYNVDFVGSMTGGPSDLGDKNHEGHSGWRIDQISNNINYWMDTYKPQIVLLHIGTNDISQKYDLNNAPNRLGDLIDKICAKLPANGKLYVATIIPISYADVRTYNSQVAAVVQNKANQGKPVYLVDMYSALTLSDLADGVHPNANGYNKMGDVWFNAIKGDLAK